MSVQIKRSTGMIGVMSSFSVKKNGEKVDKIKNDEIITVDIPEDGATIQLSQFGAKTQEQLVREGDRLEVKTTFLGKYGIFIVILLSAVLGVFFNNYVRVSVFIVYLVTVLLADGLMLQLIKIPSGRL